MLAGVDVPRLGGSSPHTRGLRPRRSGRRCGNRIIPAHAGFTHADARAPPSPRDHPRTRGVYGGLPHGGLEGRGSSPHTRGLLWDGGQGQGDIRIIPAHAGFTRWAWRHRSWPRDHPRTRGVYWRVCACACRCVGSSPHTRGLPPCAGPHSPGGGIIPAHAGFTSHRDQRHGDLTDHPRTRGVYLGRLSARPSVTGSSPHTRGLRRDVPLRAVACGIIPAHAGFTSRSQSSSRWSSDHPRTRGVYPMAAHLVSRWWGSSPHTRGLRVCVRRCVSLCGIIPAHAGFT